jgi:hypothetical protein
MAGHEPHATRAIRRIPGSRENRILGDDNVKALLIAGGTILVAYAVSTITNSGTDSGR